MEHNRTILEQIANGFQERGRIIYIEIVWRS